MLINKVSQKVRHRITQNTEGGHAAPLMHRCLWLAALVGEKVGKNGDPQT
jgi:hypothetical protein